MFLLYQIFPAGLSRSVEEFASEPFHLWANSSLQHFSSNQFSFRSFLLETASSPYAVYANYLRNFNVLYYFCITIIYFTFQSSLEIIYMNEQTNIHVSLIY